ncbi:SSI family serine proteinase inhibitor [Saccharothrix syringae]|uniref:SSI family serine proteinase inhibitor n=1 Tax=Saccharothrix syringae TaxID=103733 RepID=UPI0014770125|nr:SSI family serine proteinase inhibitor [Saccharothrix syringae]
MEATNVHPTWLTRGALPALAVAATLGAAPAPVVTAPVVTAPVVTAPVVTGTSASGTSASGTSASGTDLTVSVHDPLGRAVVREYHLTCAPDGGDHPNPRAACEAIRKSPDAVKPGPPTRNCYDRVYGSQRAKVTGLLLGVRVTSEFQRVNSCEEARWQAWLPVWG